MMIAARVEYGRKHRESGFRAGRCLPALDPSPRRVVRMSNDDLQRLPVGDLLRLEAALRNELARRGISRTATGLGGELAEHSPSASTGATCRHRPRPRST